uniref:Uncharacterized protein n=1 Tax=Strigamia maritima TaxID=126957 RepID=T1J8M8_STRMM
TSLSQLFTVYQVAYVIVKAANSPRPGNWILERSMDGITYKPWQYYAISDAECRDVFGIAPTVGNPRYMSDDEVICTSIYSKLLPLENGEIHTSLVNGRPGVSGPSDKLREFTAARYVRLRLQRIRTLYADLMTISSRDSKFVDKSVTRRYFYSIKDISIGGHCLCFGHASDCPQDPVTGVLKCGCIHNTCGDRCERCCPLYNQQPWQSGTTTNAGICEKCQCFGHAEECVYNADVDYRKQSLNIEGRYSGGGVCKNCKHFTTGVNCEKCIDGHYRPLDVSRDAPEPCIKCKCTDKGAVGHCVADDTNVENGLMPGDCICRVGFAGSNCDRCDKGYRHYPKCEPCPCEFAGTVHTECEGDCACKENVEGARCDMCKPGFFNLQQENIYGCTPCFCFGVTNQCESSDYVVAEALTFTRGWLVSDINSKRVIRPYEESGYFTIANDDMLGLELYYWLAPKEYLGNKLTAFGTKLSFSVSWVKARGDSAGRHTHGPDIIIEGSGKLIASNAKTHSTSYTSENTTKEVFLMEHEWYHLTPEGISKLKWGKKGWIGNGVSHDDFMKILYNIDRMLIRAKYHTDQIEGSLMSVFMEVGSTNSIGIRKLKSIETCRCPLGYSGLSCDKCLPGYRRVNNTIFGGECRKCDCNNHATSCDSFTGECHTCQHNTVGRHCEFCLTGFYGNPKIGTPLDCQRCACPLEDPRNNFSPTCILKNHKSPLDCADNYFGDPLVPGNFCQSCDCNANIDPLVKGSCDRFSGQCLKCLGNTTGWRCEECKEGFYGNALVPDCQKCECNLQGSVHASCDKISGQCQCKHNYVGRNCDLCADGFGGLAQSCLPCNCNDIGSSTLRCDSTSGQCECKIGVFGAKCNSCLEEYYGFSAAGCTRCNCHEPGSISQKCDPVSGICQCKPFVRGRTCNQCQNGHWNLISGGGCEDCSCNVIGSWNTECDQRTGQCRCKSGVTGRACSHCLSGYFGFSPHGCKKCDPCDAPGHLCHPLTGECVCPPNTEGKACERCKVNTWGYDPLEGCKECGCNDKGSTRLQCDSVIGRCICFDGYEGHKCDKCKVGYFDFPHCKKCRCHEEGSQPEKCFVGLGDCECDNSGQCFCKANVEGKKCKKCKDGTFGLLSSNPKGCFDCFCFGKSSKCNQSNYIWQQIVSKQEQIVYTKYGHTTLKQTNGLYILPSSDPTVTIGLQHVLSNPLYWELPEWFLGDKVLSYNGRLSFSIQVENGHQLFTSVLNSYPVVQIQGNFRIVLEHYVDLLPPDGRYVIPMHENYWRLKNSPESSVSRETMMVALQNIQYIFIRGTVSISFHSSRLFNVSLDTAVVPNSHRPTAAIGVEICECPVEYTGTSCQDPTPGYFRKRIPNFLDSKNDLDLVGFSVPCSCNGRSRKCDKETGHCQDCTDNTGGSYCDICVGGYYGDPAKGPCTPCECPTRDNNFSDSCKLDVFAGYVCTNCQQGYTGRHCEKCDHGFYGNPLLEDGKCISCNCDLRGSRGSGCNPSTGQCFCLDGIVGRDCSQCAPRHVLTAHGCQTCDDGCVGRLLNEVDELISLIKSTNLTGVVLAPWTQLFALDNTTSFLKENIDSYRDNIKRIQKLLNMFSLSDIEEQTNYLFLKAMELSSKKALGVVKKATNQKDAAQQLLARIVKVEKTVADLLKSLMDFGLGSSSTSVNLEAALREAEKILVVITKKDFSSNKKKAQSELSKAKKLLERIHQLLMNNTSMVESRQRFEDLQEKMDDLLTQIMKKITPDTKRTIGINNNNRLALQKLNATIAKINSLIDDIEIYRDDSGEFLNAAKDNYNEAEENIEIINDWIQELLNYTNELEKRTGLLKNFNPEYAKKYVEPAVAHAKKLAMIAKEIADLFAPTEKISAKPTEAIAVYKRILSAIDEAEEAAKNATNTANMVYNEIFPSNKPSLVQDCLKANEYSKDMYLNTSAFVDVIKAKQKTMAETAAELSSLESNNNRTKDELAKLKKQMKDIDSEVVANARDANETITKVQDRLTTINARIDKVDARIRDELKPRVDLLASGTTAGIENLTKIVDAASKNIGVAKRSMEDLSKAATRLKNLNEMMELNLSELKNKIKIARQTADGISVSLTDYNGECVRSYQPQVQPTTTSHIVLNYAINSHARNAFLFYLGNSNLVDFMAIEMVDRKIRFIWNAGGGVEFIEHKKLLQTNTDLYEYDKRWYKIELVRINNIATLSVQSTPDSVADDLYKVTSSSSPENLRMDLNSSSHLYIGGFPDDKPPPQQIKTKNFAGCLHEVIIDGKRLGLWNFITTKGCTGCKEGASENRDTDENYYFQGDGYAIQPQVRRVSKHSYNIQLAFKSYDENSLLFFTANEPLRQFFSLELRNGKLLFQFCFASNFCLTLLSDKQYNTGDWSQIKAAITEHYASISIGDEIKDVDVPEINGPGTLELKNSEIFFGGVAPDFNYSSWQTVGFGSFLGCMRGIHIYTSSLNLDKGRKYGLQAGCRDTMIKSVLFKGDGSLEKDSQTLHKSAHLAFSFQTSQNDTLLLLSTFEGKFNTEGRQINDSYSISLSNGQIHCMITAGESTLKISTPDIYNDCTFHTISIIKSRRSIELRIDDNRIKLETLQKGPGSLTVDSPTEGGLYFGGVPIEIKNQVKHLSTSLESLNGQIKDVVFNDKLMLFNEPRRFKNVGIGRTSELCVVTPIPVPGLPENHLMKQPMKCKEIAPFITIQTAMKFGDKPHSYLQLNLKKRTLGAKFTIEFDFNTFYPNGMLFFLKNSGRKAKHYFVVALRSSKVVVTAQANGDVDKIQSAGNMNTGKWIKVQISKHVNKLVLIVDNKTVDIPHSKKIKVHTPVYIGGVSENISLPDQLMVENFKGCIRSFKIKGKIRDLARGQMHNVGQCLQNVEAGAYFAGDAYAIYSAQYSVGKSVEIELDFKTTRLSGILLSISENKGSPALALEIEDGNVTVTVDKGDGQPFFASQAFQLKYYICDNKWHKIKVIYSGISVHLYVDSSSAFGYSRNQDVGDMMTEGPFYIGGLPDNVEQGVLRTRSNFVGCIRNYVINGRRVDWTDMSLRHNSLQFGKIFLLFICYVYQYCEEHSEKGKKKLKICKNAKKNDKFESYEFSGFIVNWPFKGSKGAPMKGLLNDESSSGSGASPSVPFPGARNYGGHLSLEKLNGDIENMSLNTTVAKSASFKQCGTSPVIEIDNKSDNIYIIL